MYVGFLRDPVIVVVLLRMEILDEGQIYLVLLAHLLQDTDEESQTVSLDGSISVSQQTKYD